MIKPGGEREGSGMCGASPSARENQPYRATILLRLPTSRFQFRSPRRWSQVPTVVVEHELLTAQPYEAVKKLHADLVAVGLLHPASYSITCTHCRGSDEDMSTRFT